MDGTSFLGREGMYNWLFNGVLGKPEQSYGAHYDVLVTGD